jgi:hypothetical protein
VTKKLLQLLDRCDGMIRVLSHESTVTAKKLKQSIDIISDIQLIKKQILSVTGDTVSDQTQINSVKNDTE